MGACIFSYIVDINDEMARPRNAQLSPTHRKIASAIASIERAGFPALVSELVRKLDLAGGSSLAPTLRIMQRNGFVSISGGGCHGRDRLVKLTSKGRFAIAAGGLAVHGSIRAGLLEEAVAEPEAVFEDHDLLPYCPGDFLLRVRGDSMTGNGILPGDYVLLRPNVQVEQGEIAAVMVGDEYEATLKRVQVEGTTVRLVAGNPNYADLVVSAADVRIAGVFRGLIRHADKAK